MTINIIQNYTYRVANESNKNDAHEHVSIVCVNRCLKLRGVLLYQKYALALHFYFTYYFTSLQTLTLYSTPHSSHTHHTHHTPVPIPLHKIQMLIHKPQSRLLSHTNQHNVIPCTRTHSSQPHTMILTHYLNTAHTPHPSSAPPTKHIHNVAPRIPTYLKYD